LHIEYAKSMATTRERKKRFVVCLTERELERLRAEAAERGLAVSDLIRRIIDKHYEDKA